MKVLIRTDANEVIASGHLMRCITLANAFIQKGGDVKFIVSDKDSEKILKKNVFEYYCLNSDWENVMSEIPSVSEIIMDERCDILLVDTYSAKAEYYYALKNFTKLACFDDMFLEKYPVDLLINYNIYYREFDYRLRYQGEKTKLLLGTKYVPLREEFQMLDDKYTKDGIKDILLICGGGDYYNFLGQYIKELIDKKIFLDINWHVVIGAYNQNEDQLKQYSIFNKNIIVHKEVVNMGEIIQSCDLIISAASTVLYECVACCRPVMFFCMADNQELDVQAFQKYAQLIYLGDIRYNIKSVINRSFQLLRKCINRDVDLGKMVEVMPKIIDGKGASRIVDSMIQLCFER